MTHVIILGGGVAGLSAAQELAERGFEVSVYERRFLAGGKAEAFRLSPSRAGGEFVEAIHAHEAGAAGSLVPANTASVSSRVSTNTSSTRCRGFLARRRVRCRPTGSHEPGSRFAVWPANDHIPDRFPSSPPDVATVLADISPSSVRHGLEPEEVAFFVARGPGRSHVVSRTTLAEYERISWWEYIDAETRPDAYQKLLASGITRSLVAAKARTASTKTWATSSSSSSCRHRTRRYRRPTGCSTDRPTRPGSTRGCVT